MILISKENQNHFMTQLPLWDTIHYWHHLQQSNGCLATRRNWLWQYIEKLLMLKANHYEPQW